VWNACWLCWVEHVRDFIVVVINTGNVAFELSCLLGFEGISEEFT
jgi:hypothetical protein